MSKAIENDDHKEWFELLPLYVNRSLDAEKTLAVEKHLKKCIECQNELSFERSMQESISAVSDVDVAEISQRNLPKFNTQLDQLIAKKSVADASIADNEMSIHTQSKNSIPLMQRVYNYGRTLLTPRPALGGALALGCCALVVVSVISRSGDSGQTQSPLRGCEHLVKQHELRIVTSNTGSVTGSAKNILEEYFPGSGFTVEALDNKNVVVNLTGDTCMIPLVVNELEKLLPVNSVTVN